VALVRRVLLPAAQPALLTGLRNGLSLAWMFMVAAELIASTRGLGFLLIDGQSTVRPDIMLVGIITLAILGKLTDALIGGFERWSVRRWT
jgi:sulfonate transport system permease protein